MVLTGDMGLVPVALNRLMQDFGITGLQLKWQSDPMKSTLLTEMCSGRVMCADNFCTTRAQQAKQPIAVKVKAGAASQASVLLQGIVPVGRLQPSRGWCFELLRPVQCL